MSIRKSILVFVLSIAAATTFAADNNIVLHYATFDPRVSEPAIAPELRAPAGSRIAIVQLTGPPQGAWIDEMRASGVVFYDSIPNNAYIVRLGSTPLTASYIRWVGAYHPAYKLSPYLGTDALLVDFFPDTNLAAIASAVAATGATIEKSIDGDRDKLMLVRASAAQLPKLAAIDAVRWIQKRPVNRMMNADARWVIQGYVKGQTPLHDKGITGKGQIGAVSDSGLDAYDYVNTTGQPQGTDPVDASCYFVDDGAGGTTSNQIIPSPTHRKVVGYAVPGDAVGDFTDESGHGTHVVGSVVGDTAPWGAVTAADGQAYEARVFFQDLNVGGGLFISAPSNYRVMFQQANDAGARTHSNSWGGVEPLYDTGTSQADDFMWTNPDFLILYAAGNQGPAPDTVGNPAAGKNIVTVGATENGTANPENVADFSSHGPIPVSNRLKPEVVAPGAGIISAQFKNACGSESNSGTSMATPTVNGVALLMRQYLADGFYPKGQADSASSIHPSAALLKAMLMNSGAPMSGLFTDNGIGGTWPSNGQGWGRILADDALYFQGDHRSLHIVDDYAVDGSRGFAASGESREFTIDVRNGEPLEREPLEITLAWSDYRGSSTSNGALVNNLDLVVIDPAGGVHRGNDTATNDFTNKTDLPLTSPDTANPWEVVFIKDPMPGVYTVRVTASSIASRAIDPNRKQGFAVVATGDLVGSRGRVEIEYDRYDVPTTAVANLRLTDVDLNVNPGAADQVTVNVSSSSNPAGIAVTLTEHGVNSGIFSGAVTLSSTATAGTLLVADNNSVRVTYNDANDGTGAAFVAYDTAKIAAPTLNAVNPPRLADPGDLSTNGNFTLSWSHAESTTNLIEYTIEESSNYVEALFDDAEGSQSANWTTDMNPPINPPWTQNPAYAQSPSLSYWSSANELVGPVDIDTSLTLNRDVSIPAGAASARLTFYSRYFNDADDEGNIEISTDGGASWSKLYTITRAGIPDPDRRMQHHDLDLSSYIGRSFRIRFRFYSGPGNFVAEATPGWWVDDVTISGGTWRRIASVPASETSLQLSRRNGTYAYRVSGVYATGTATAWSNVESIAVNKPMVHIDDNNPAVEYTGGWHLKESSSASNGVYHTRVGSKKGNNSTPPTARLVFSGSEITVFYATSDKGGVSDVTIDGATVGTISYAGSTKDPLFGASVTYDNLGAGKHEIVIAHRSGVAFIDGFRVEAADASASQFTSSTTSTGLLSQSLTLGASAAEISVTIEGSSVPLDVSISDALGGTIASGGVLLDGTTITGVDAAIPGGGIYSLNITGASLTPVTVTITTTSRK